MLYAMQLPLKVEVRQINEILFYCFGILLIFYALVKKIMKKIHVIPGTYITGQWQESDLSKPIKLAKNIISSWSD